MFLYFSLFTIRKILSQLTFFEKSDIETLVNFNWKGVETIENIIRIIAPAEGLSTEITRQEAVEKGVPSLLPPLVSEEDRDRIENLDINVNSNPYGQQGERT